MMTLPDTAPALAPAVDEVVVAVLVEADEVAVEEVELHQHQLMAGLSFTVYTTTS